MEIEKLWKDELEKVERRFKQGRITFGEAERRLMALGLTGSELAAHLNFLRFVQTATN